MRGKSSALRAKEEFLALYHDGAFEAGTKIPSESSMAEMLGVSRETWRKALGLLRGELLVGARLLGLALERSQLPGHLPHHVACAQEVLVQIGRAHV